VNPYTTPHTTPRHLPDGPVLLDASFVIALFDDEDAAQPFTTVLSRAVMVSVTAGEVYYKLAARTGIDPEVVETILTDAGVSLVALPLPAARSFPTLKALDEAHRSAQRAAGDKPARPLSLADLCVLGYALHTGLPVLTGDRHWTTLAEHSLTVPVYDFRDPTTQP
jgi:PIN domain nuclease of toxin-antitoxin system